MLAWTIFSLSVILAIGVFGYRYYLKYSIDKMATDLETARTNLQSEMILELTRLDNRIISTNTLVSKHRVITPFFAFLQGSTAQTVRFSDLSLLMGDSIAELDLKGEARGYDALAFQAEVFNESKHFANSIFSDLELNERGDVIFSFKGTINPELVSYSSQLTR